MSMLPSRRPFLGALGVIVVAALILPISALSADVPVATVPAGTGPISIGINPVTSRVYVADYNGHTVGVIDGTTDSLVATVSLAGGTFPNCIVVNPLASPARAYVGDFWTGDVKVIDESSVAVTATLQSGSAHGGGPRALALDAGGATPKLFVADYGTGTCSVFNAVTNALITRIPVGPVPRALGIFVSVPRRRVFVANRGDGTVSVIDGAANVVVATLPTGGKPKAIAVDDSTGFAYITNEASNTVTVIDANDEVTATVSVGSRPIGIAVDSAGERVFVSNFDSNNVSVIRTSDFSIEATVMVGTSPWGVAVDSGRRKAFVTNYANGTVSVIASDLAVATCTVGTNPQALAVDESVDPHRVYVGNFGSNDLTVIADDQLGMGGFAPDIAYAAEPGPVTASVDQLAGDVTLDPRVPITGEAHSARPIASAIAAVLVSVDGGEWVRAEITSGSGTPDVEWRLDRTVALALGSHTVRVLAFDETGAASSTSEMGSGGKMASEGGSALYRFGVATTTRYEQNDSRIAYKGVWTGYPHSSYSGGSLLRATSAGSELTFAIDGTAVGIVALTGPYYGKARVTVDDGASELVDLYSPAYLYRQVIWSKSGLAPGSHTVKVECTGLGSGLGAYINIDAIDVVGSLSTASAYPTRYEQNDSRIAYKGVWTGYPHSSYSGGSLLRATSAGSELTFAIDGTAVGIVALTGPYYGKARVTVDDGASELVDLYSPAYLYRQVIWSKSGLAPGSHTVKVECTGLGSGLGAYINIDAIDVVGSLSTASAYPTRYEQNDSRIAYKGVWTGYPHSSYSGGSLLRATSAGSELTFAIDGTAVGIVALTGPYYGKARVTVDDGASELVDLYSPAYLYRQVIWSKSGLAPGSHTVKVECTGLGSGLGAYINIDAIDVVGSLTP